MALTTLVSSILISHNVWGNLDFYSYHLCIQYEVKVISQLYKAPNVFFLTNTFIYIIHIFVCVTFHANDYCFTADPLVGSIATQYLQNREEHDRIARLWTKRYATWLNRFMILVLVFFLVTMLFKVFSDMCKNNFEFKQIKQLFISRNLITCIFFYY